MKIVSVMTTSARGGAEFAAIEMLAALRERGHETVMLSNQDEIARETGVPVRTIDIGPKMALASWRSLLVNTPRYLQRLKRALEAEYPYDVLLLHYKKEQVWAPLLPAHLRATLVWSEWGKVPFQFHEGIPHRLYERAGRQADAVMAISQGTLESVVDQGVERSKIEVVPNVLRVDEIDYTADGRARVRRELGIPDDAFVVGTISRLNRKKRNDVVIDAVKRLDDERVHFIIGGDGETEAELRARAAPLAGRGHFIPTPKGDVADVLSAFDVSVFCPSPTEGAPRAVILGMLARRPCLSTGPEGVDDMIRPEFGRITDRLNDPDSLADVLQSYLSDPELARRQGEAARTHAEATYAAPVVAARIEELFRRAGAGHANGNGA